MAQRAAAAIAGDAAGGDFNDFGHFDGHGRLWNWEDARGSYKLGFAGQEARFGAWSSWTKSTHEAAMTAKAGSATAAALAKTDLRFAAIGAVDEANSAIGVARLEAEGDMDAMLARIQNDLFDLGADLSAPDEAAKPKAACASRRRRWNGWSGRSTR